jgi:hypothetical protein
MEENNEKPIAKVEQASGRLELKFYIIFLIKEPVERKQGVTCI